MVAEEICKIDSGIILLECALLAELDLLHICNNRVIVVKEPEEKEHIRRLAERGLDSSQISDRLYSQFSTKKKIQTIQNCISNDNYGRMFIHQSGDQIDPDDISLLAYTKI